MASTMKELRKLKRTSRVSFLEMFLSQFLMNLFNFVNICRKVLQKYNYMDFSYMGYRKNHFMYQCNSKKQQLMEGQGSFNEMAQGIET